MVVAGVARGSGTALLAHLARRVTTSGLTALVMHPGRGAPLFHLLASELGVREIVGDVGIVAETLARTAAQRKSVVLSPLPAEGSWDSSVAAELVSLRAALFVFVSESDATLPGAERFDVMATLSEGERLRWLGLASEHANRLLGSSRSWNELEIWWSRVQSLSAAPSRAALDGLAQELHQRLTLAARPWPKNDLERLGADLTSALPALVASGLVVSSDAHVSLSALPALTTPHGGPSVSEEPPSDRARAVAHALVAEFVGDPWAEARAAELLRAAGDWAGADKLHAGAIGKLGDAIARREVRARWFGAVASAEQTSQLALRLSAAERALEAGEPEEAQRWAESAMPLAPDHPGIMLLLGRAFVGLGDLVAGRLAFQKIREAHCAASQAPGCRGALAQRIAVELAELAYEEGSFEEARREALNAAPLERAGVDSAVRLRARNVLGKILLAEARWVEADSHFAADAFSAHEASLVTAGLRARLNRAIAIQSKGMLDEAERMLRAVLEDAERANEQRASAYALTNLAVIAWTRHEYGAGLELLERTLRLRSALGDRAAISHTIASLAELRLRLGLFDHALHMVTFARRVPMSAASSSQFGVVAARIALAKGDTAAARREIEGALVDARAANNKDWLGEAFRVAARISLEDGDVAGCRTHLERAAELASTDRGRAEVALIGALVGRASGESSFELAHEALGLARASGEEEVLSEVLHLLTLMHRDAGDLSSARGACAQAMQIRNRVAEGLRSEVRSAFLSRPDSLAIARLHLLLTEPGEDEAPRTERSPLQRGGCRPSSFPSSHTPLSAPRELVGDDPQILALVAAIKKVGRSSSTVLIRGESGTGKELVAEALHRASERAGGPLVTVNCAALVETLLLSELFGHEKGAFTGAAGRRRGRFELAEGGTLFLDEIGDISPRTQVALLRVLQEKTFERVGGSAPIQANVRVVCATHRDLKAMVERGEFREDLYYRLRGIALEVPALRNRLGDLQRIAEHLLSRIAAERSSPSKRLAPEALDLLCRHRWPGNVRELENALRAAALFAETETIGLAELVENVEELRGAAAQVGPSTSQATGQAAGQAAGPVTFRAGPPRAASGEDDDGPTPIDGALPTDEATATAVAYEQVRQGAISLSDMKRQIERDCIARALSETKGNITKAAALLGMKRPRLSQLVKQYGLAAASTEVF